MYFYTFLLNIKYGIYYRKIVNETIEHLSNIFQRVYSNLRVFKIAKYESAMLKLVNAKSINYVNLFLILASLY